MLLKKLKESPEKMVSFGMMLIVVGLMLIVLGVLWPRIPVVAQLWPIWNDFLRGFVFGVAIVFEIAGVVINTTAAKKKRKAL